MNYVQNPINVIIQNRNMANIFHDTWLAISTNKSKLIKSNRIEQNNEMKKVHVEQKHKTRIILLVPKLFMLTYMFQNPLYSLQHEKNFFFRGKMVKTFDYSDTLKAHEKSCFFFVKSIIGHQTLFFMLSCLVCVFDFKNPIKSI